MNSDHNEDSRLIEENRLLRQRQKQLESLLNQIIGEIGGDADPGHGLSTWLDALPVGVYVYQDDRIKYANRTAFDLVGLDADTSDVNQILAYVPSEYRRTIAQVARARQEGREVDDPYPVRIAKASGEAAWLLIRGQVIQFQGSPATLGVAVDFTVYKQGADLIAASQSNLEAILENTEDYILLSDRKGFPVYFNSAYARIMKEVLGIDVRPGVKPHTFLPDEADRQVWEGFHKRVLGGERFVIEYFVKDAAGKDHYLEVAYYPIVEAGEVTGFCEFTHEVTEAKLARMELDLTRQEQTEQLRRVAGGIAHEVHNSLFPLSASVYLLKQFLQGLEHERAEYFLGLVEMMEKSLSRSIDLTDSVVKLSRLEDFASVSTGLKGALSEVLDHNRERVEDAGAAVEIDIPEQLTVNCPALYLSQVLDNLVVNALDALKDAPVRRLSATASDDPGFVRLRLSDSGSGIAPENQAKIFDPFFSTKAGEGTGIGLAIVKRVVDLCGGKISVESAPGSGTTMTIELPRGKAG